MSAQRPDWSRSALASCLRSKDSYSIVASASMSMDITLRRSPRTMATTLPLTGDVKSISANALSWKRGVPAFTLSPSRTMSFGVTPAKWSGTMWKIAGRFTLPSVRAAAPSNGMSKPRFSWIFCMMLMFLLFCFMSFFKILPFLVLSIVGLSSGYLRDK